MKKHLYLCLIAFLLVLSENGLGQSVSNAECTSVRTGEFVDGTLSYVTITRDSVSQVETDTRTGKKSYFKVEWTDSCTYTLTFVKSDEKKMKKSAKKIGVLTIEITYVDEDGYRYYCTAPGLETPIRGSVKRKK